MIAILITQQLCRLNTCTVCPCINQGDPLIIIIDMQSFLLYIYGKTCQAFVFFPFIHIFSCFIRIAIDIYNCFSYPLAIVVILVISCTTAIDYYLFQPIFSVILHAYTVSIQMIQAPCNIAPVIISVFFRGAAAHYCFRQTVAVIASSINPCPVSRAAGNGMFHFYKITYDIVIVVVDITTHFILIVGITYLLFAYTCSFLFPLYNKLLLCVIHQK